MGEKIDDKHRRGRGLGQPGGQGRPPHPPVEMHDKDVVQHHVHQAAGDNADDADMGRAVGLDQGGGDDHEQVLVKVVAGPLHVLLSQGDGQDGGGAGGQQDAQGEHQRHEGQGQVDGGEGVLSHAPGHEHAVHQGVEREDPHGHDGRNGEFEKAAYQVQVHNPLLLRSC